MKARRLEISVVAGAWQELLFLPKTENFNEPAAGTVFLDGRR